MASDKDTGNKLLSAGINALCGKKCFSSNGKVSTTAKYSLKRLMRFEYSSEISLISIASIVSSRAIHFAVSLYFQYTNTLDMSDSKSTALS